MTMSCEVDGRRQGNSLLVCGSGEIFFIKINFNLIAIRSLRRGRCSLKVQEGHGWIIGEVMFSTCI